MLKKVLLSLVMIVSLRTHAISGLISGDDKAVVLGLVLMDISQIYVVDERVRRSRGRRVVYTTVRVVTYVPLFIAGLVILDDNGKMTFGELEADVAIEAGISKEEALSYNSELEEVNAIKDIISSKLVKVTGTKKIKAEAAKVLWTEYQEYVSPETFSALVKLVKMTL